jgi:hypothetical protein
MIEQSQIIKFFADDGCTGIEVHQRLQDHSGQSAMSHTEVYIWIQDIQGGTLDHLDCGRLFINNHADINTVLKTVSSGRFGDPDWNPNHRRRGWLNRSCLLERAIGPGMKGKVKLARNRETGELIPIKVISKSTCAHKPGI